MRPGNLRTPSECDSSIFPPINGGCPDFPQVNSFQICKCDGTVEDNPPSPPPPQTEAECKSRCRTECYVTPGPPWEDGGLWSNQGCKAAADWLVDLEIIEGYSLGATNNDATPGSVDGILRYHETVMWSQK